MENKREEMKEMIYEAIQNDEFKMNKQDTHYTIHYNKELINKIFNDKYDYTAQEREIILEILRNDSFFIEEEKYDTYVKDYIAEIDEIIYEDTESYIEETEIVFLKVA